MAEAEAVLRELLNKIALEHNFDKNEMNIKPINSGGANYTSMLFLINVKVPGEKDVELFAKVACIGEKLRELMSADRMFYLEGVFYKKLSKVYIKLEQEQHLSVEDRFVYPKFYGCDTNKMKETIVLENLVTKGYESYDRFISVDWEHAAASIEALARFHALSFAYQKDSPEEFEELCKDLVFQEPRRDESTKATFAKYIERSVNVVKEEYRPRILKFLEGLGLVKSGITQFRKPLSAKVIVHGDFRPSNLLYKRQGDKVHAIPVDYQTIHAGSPAADFLYFELCGTDSQFRAEYHDRLLEHYYRELTAALQRLGVDATEVYPREVLDNEMKEMAPFLILLGIFLLPVVLVEAENAPKIDAKDCGVESFIIPSSDLFEERFRGIVEDCVRQGVI